MLEAAVGLALEKLRYQEHFFHCGSRPSLPHRNKFTGARKIQRAAKKRRNRMRGRS